MIFVDFLHKLSKAIRGGSNTGAFTKTVIEAILNNDGLELLSKYKASSFKSYYSGQTSISRLAKKINTKLEPDSFAEYIHQHSDAAVQNLCDIFSADITDLTPFNAGEKLAALFVEILTEAAEDKKRTSNGSGADKVKVIATRKAKKLPEVTDFENGILLLDDGVNPNDNLRTPFTIYLEKAYDYYSMKKTLLYPEKPRPFYEIYVCNDLRYHKIRFTGYKDTKPEITIQDANVQRLEQESRYIIIEGTGGIGKSMFLTHLFLSASSDCEDTGEIPIFMTLKDYKENLIGIVDFIRETVAAYDSNITQKHIIEALENKQLILLLDGMDEIPSALRDAFNTDLEAFIKSYPGNSVFITSRPIYSFISYTRFSLFDIMPLKQEQALALIQKLDFWDKNAKQDFLIALKTSLYYTHRQFASNPLLLTIMLMTYSTFGEVPAKIHVFYSKAFETMSRLHDATKGSFKRPLHTKITPEKFSMYFAQFCARTYIEEVLEFDERTFSSYMNKVIRNMDESKQEITSGNFLLDLTDNLCIMYHEGTKYYFIHRSFQEYFAAVYFASNYDEKLSKVGKFFENSNHRSYTDRTFAMLYDMIPKKIERYIFFPFLEQLIDNCKHEGQSEEYWAFLELQYPHIYYEDGATGEHRENSAKSFLYRTIINVNSLSCLPHNIEELDWPQEINSLPYETWVGVYRNFMGAEAYERNPNPDDIDDEELEDMDIIPVNEVYYRYADYFGTPDVEGKTIDISIEELRKNPSQYKELRAFMEDPKFPLVKEYKKVKKYFRELKSWVNREDESELLFDD